MPDDVPSLTDKARKAQEEKQKRLAEALRANLHRRKSQARARAEEPVAEGDKSAQDETSS